MKYFWFLKLVAISATISLISVGEAKADLRVCNRSSYKAYVAVSYYNRQSVWNSFGWKHVFGGECETVFRGDMRLNAPYVYITDNNWNPWKLSVSDRVSYFCITQSRFNIVNANRRCERGMQRVQFQRVISNNYDKVLFLN